MALLMEIRVNSMMNWTYDDMFWEHLNHCRWHPRVIVQLLSYLHIIVLYYSCTPTNDTQCGHQLFINIAVIREYAPRLVVAECTAR